MATNKLIGGLLLIMSLGAWAREPASPAACQAAGAQAPIANAISKAASSADLHDTFLLADAWSEAGCFNQAVQVLSAAAQGNPESKELKTRLRVARSVVGEEHFFESLDRVDDEARLKRAIFRCASLADSVACGDAVRMRPDDASLWSARGDALMHDKRAAEALVAYQHAASIKPEQPDMKAKLAAAQDQLSSDSAPGSDARVPVIEAHQTALHRAPARLARVSTRTQPTYSNLEQESHSH